MSATKKLESRLEVIQGHTSWQKSIPRMLLVYSVNNNFRCILSRFRDIVL